MIILKSISRKTQIFLISFILLFSISPNGSAEEESDDVSKPLLRVYPIYRIEECEWAIRFDICHKCIARKEKYAQKIYFQKDKPYRVHGCYTESKGFYTLE